MTTGLREIAGSVPKQVRGSAVGVYYVLTYIGFALPFAHAIVAKSRGDVRTLLLTAGAALACLVLRGSLLAARRSQH